MQNIVSKEWKAESARRYQAHLARRRKATVDANAASMLNKPTPIVVNANGSGEYHFKDDEPLPPKFDWTVPANRSRPEAAVIALRASTAVETRFKNISTPNSAPVAMPSNERPKGRYPDEPPQDNSAYTSAAE